MVLKREWLRVTRREPCKVCGKPDWCSYTLDEPAGSACMRVESAKPMANGSWFHPFADGYVPPKPLRNPMLQPSEPEPDFGEMMRDWRELPQQDLSKELGVSAQSLEWLGATWTGDAMAFPMYDAESPNRDGVIGIRLRLRDGKKLAVKGSHSGIFFPYGAMMFLNPWERIFICEGPTDTAACLDMGYFSIGRASCRGGEGYVMRVIEQLEPSEVIVVCDNDGPGLEGANDLMRRIKCRKTRLVPPGKDLRKFLSDGGNREILEAMLKNLIRK